jgi:putative ATP-dependent endonuclease of OLD family
MKQLDDSKVECISQVASMYLSRVEVKNFRSLKNVTMNLEPGLNVIVGRNNTGKTNLFAAIRHAIGPAGARGEALWLSRDDFYKASAREKSAEIISITLTFERLTEDQRAHFFEIVDFNVTNLAQSRAVLHFEASWPEGKRHAAVERWGGGPSTDRTPVPAEILESLPITFLPALRDAEAALEPGFKSRLALLLRDLAERPGSTAQTDILEIFQSANEKLEKHDLIRDVKESLQGTTKAIAGTDYTPSAIRAAELDFVRVLRTLRVQMDDMPIGDLAANGLGYNNLLYIGVILEHLKTPQRDECPLLLVEEPEAHLHPQLTMLLAEYLANKVPGGKIPQTIVTTHSPTLAASVPPSRVHVLFADSTTKEPRCNSIAKSGMDKTEEMALQRMLDISRATLYFAKGVILVEGISESLLLSVLARRLKHDLSKLHISVIPICGVAFETFKKMLHPDALGIPAAIVTDADPPIERGEIWEEDQPESENGAFRISDRTVGLLRLFYNNATVEVHHSQVTLEYDLAEAGDSNATLMVEVWQDCFEGNPRTFTSERLSAAGSNRRDKALCAWRGICRASHSASKAEFAQRLAARLDQFGPDEKPVEVFEVPKYIKDAIDFVVGKVKAIAPPVGGSGT